MSVHITEVLNYLENHFGGKDVENVESALKTLYDTYYLHNCVDGEEVCREREVLAFSQGILVGMLFMTEVNWLP